MLTSFSLETSHFLLGERKYPVTDFDHSVAIPSW